MAIYVHNYVYNYIYESKSFSKFKRKSNYIYVCMYIFIIILKSLFRSIHINKLTYSIILVDSKIYTGYYRIRCKPYTTTTYWFKL